MTEDELYSEKPGMDEIFARQEYKFMFFAGIAMSMFAKSMKYIAPIAFLVFIPVYFTAGLALRGYDANALLAMPTEEAMEYLMSGLFPASLLSAGLNAIFTPIVFMACYSVIKHTFAKKVLTIGTILDDILYSWWKLVATSAIYFAFLLLSAFLIVVPLYLAVIFYFFQCVIIFSDKWGIAGLFESREIIKGRFFKALGYVLICELMRLLISYLVGLVYVLIPDGSVTNTYAGIVIDAVVSSVVQFLGLYVIFITGLWFKNWDLCRRIKPVKY